MNRQLALTLADEAASRATALARQAQRAVDNGDSMGQLPSLAAAGSLWADVARAQAAIAAAMTETEGTDG